MQSCGAGHYIGAWPSDLSGATIKAIIHGVAEFDCVATVPSGATQTIQCELTGVQTALIVQHNTYTYQIVADMGGDGVNLVPLVTGQWTSLEKATST